jgi:hypothetical protein
MKFPTIQKEYATDGSWEPVWDRTVKWGHCMDCNRRFIWKYTELDAEVCDVCIEYGEEPTHA